MALIFMVSLRKLIWFQVFDYAQYYLDLSEANRKDSEITGDDSAGSASSIQVYISLKWTANPELEGHSNNTGGGRQFVTHTFVPFKHYL